MFLIFQMGKSLPRTTDHSPSPLSPHQTGVSFSQVGKIINIFRSSSNTRRCLGQNNSQKFLRLVQAVIASKLFLHHPSSWQASSGAGLSYTLNWQHTRSCWNEIFWAKEENRISIWATARASKLPAITVTLATLHFCMDINSSYYTLIPQRILRIEKKNLKYYLL